MPTALHTTQQANAMSAWFIRLRSRNRLLYYFGWFNFIAAGICLVLTYTDVDNVINNSNAWLKPLRFFLSIGILCWTLSWLLVYVQKQRAVKFLSIATIITMVFEMLVIAGQAARGQLSHFNISTSFNAWLYVAMGVAITFFTLNVLYVAILLFRQKTFPLWMSEGYKWGIRWGLLLFVVFAFEGGIMAALLRHTIGMDDGTEGLPFFNWSLIAGDLRLHTFLACMPCRYYRWRAIFLRTNAGKYTCLPWATCCWLRYCYGRPSKAIPFINPSVKPSGA